MNLSFLPNLAFPEAKVFDKVVKLCKKADQKGAIERRQRWLGALFADDIERGAHNDFVIRWIDGKVGYGVFATKDMAPFAFVGEYTGEVRKRVRDDKRNSYCFTYLIGDEKKSSYIIDAEKKGNITRFINHSDTPNLEPISVFSGGVMHVILLTRTWIQKGQQLTYDYGEDYWKKREKPLLFQ
ncbi:MAG: SET domain-containing protein-lysine N-methyltransferase [Chlamydiales bacterium]|nr:SET domain-containing protein-lysine N-methyltransferase [Chlamydiales bacterium]